MPTQDRLLFIYKPAWIIGPNSTGRGYLFLSGGYLFLSGRGGRGGSALLSSFYSCYRLFFYAGVGCCGLDDLHLSLYLSYSGVIITPRCSPLLWGVRPGCFVFFLLRFVFPFEMIGNSNNKY